MEVKADKKHGASVGVGVAEESSVVDVSTDVGYGGEG